MSNSDASRISVPVDQRGHAIREAMGLPILRDDQYLGHDDYAILYDLSAEAYKRRSFTGFSIVNPSASTAIILASVEDIMDTPTDFWRIGASQFAVVDRLRFGPGMQDDTSGNRTKFILAKLSTAQGVLASGTIDYSGSGQPSDQDTVVIAGITYEFSDDVSKQTSSDFLVTIGATADDSWTNLVNKINLTQRYVTATINTTTDVVTITANIGGTTGNSITIADGSTGAAFSGATLASGSGGVLPTVHIW